jgi:hypothetical protein
MVAPVSPLGSRDQQYAMLRDSQSYAYSVPQGSHHYWVNPTAPQHMSYYGSARCAPMPGPQVQVVYPSWNNPNHSPRPRYNSSMASPSGHGFCGCGCREGVHVVSCPPTPPGVDNVVGQANSAAALRSSKKPLMTIELPHAMPCLVLEDSFPDTASVASEDAASIGALSDVAQDHAAFMDESETNFFFDIPESLHSGSFLPPITEPSQHDQSIAQSSHHNQSNKNDDVNKPNDSDVLCGRGGKTLMHNRHFADLCSKFVVLYSTTKKRGMNGKRGIALGIVREIKDSQGRFLKPSDKGGWEEISDEQAMIKVGHCIRDVVRRQSYKKRK